MNLGAATTMVREAMANYGLTDKGWTFSWDGSKKRFGLCSYGHRRIKMSRALTLVNDESEVRDTLLHEIAHALVGPGNGHGIVWKLKAQSIGARPVACYTSDHVKAVDAPYTFKCLDCGVVGTRFKMPRPWLLLTGRHRTCGHKPNGGKLEWRKHGQIINTVERVTPTAPQTHTFQHQVAACAPKPEVKPEDLSQSDIKDMWERLNRLEGK